MLGFVPIYMAEDHPLPWLTPLLNGVEHANFFETRATEYSKGATRGDWNTVWVNFDQRRKAKVSDVEVADDGSEPDMFGERGGTQAAEEGRSEERRVGKECVRTCRSRWSPYH